MKTYIVKWVPSLICAVVYDESLDELREQGIRALAQGADMVEARLDKLAVIDFDQIKEFLEENRDLPIIFSLRSEWNSETIEPPIKGRKDNLRRLITLAPKYIDLEFPIDMSLLKEVNPNTIPVISALDFEGMAKIAFDSLVNVANSYDGEIIIKISCLPNTVEDLKQLWRWARKLQKEKIEYVIVGMGQLGQISRIKSRELGNKWMYGRFHYKQGEPFLPGMLEIDQLSKAFANESWHLASLGNLPETDILRIIYNQLLEAAHMEGVFLNLPVKTSPELDQILLWIEDGLLDGVNISSPWQVEILNRLDQLDASAQVMGAVNCVVVTKDGLRGYNTQIDGFKRSIEPFSLKRINRVFIDGTERIARAVIHVLKDQVETIVVRDEMFTTVPSPLFDDFPMITPSQDSYSNDFDLIVNCNKPARGFENVVMIPKPVIDKAKIVFDPMSKLTQPTPIMEMAQSLDKTTLGGFQFFFNTALSSFELWTKRSIPPSAIDKNLFESFHDKIDFGFMLNY